MTNTNAGKDIVLDLCCDKEPKVTSWSNLKYESFTIECRAQGCPKLVHIQEKLNFNKASETYSLLPQIAMKVWNAQKAAEQKAVPGGENEPDKNVGDDLELFQQLVDKMAKAYIAATGHGLPSSAQEYTINTGIVAALTAIEDLIPIHQQSSVKVDDGALKAAHAKRCQKHFDSNGTAGDDTRDIIEWYLEALRSSEMPNGSGKED